MDDLQAQVSAILGNPEMMQKISAMAQSLSSASQPEPPKAPPPEQPPNFDPGLIQKIAGFAGQTGIDRNQKNLLQALNPYLSKDRISRLERAMRAAAMAKMASGFLGR